MAKEPSVSGIEELIAAAVRVEIAKVMTATTPDERMAQEMGRIRGQNRPLPEEFLVPCRSPITGATFTARLISSRTLGARVIELLDYTRPDGWDKKKADGGLVDDGDHMPIDMKHKGYTMWLYKEFWMRDTNAVAGKPLPTQWRADYAPAPGSVVLTPEQLTKLGISAEQVEQALKQAAE